MSFTFFRLQQLKDCIALDCIYSFNVNIVSSVNIVNIGNTGNIGNIGSIGSIDNSIAIVNVVINIVNIGKIIVIQILTVFVLSWDPGGAKTTEAVAGVAVEELTINFDLIDNTFERIDNQQLISISLSVSAFDRGYLWKTIVMFPVLVIGSGSSEPQSFSDDSLELLSITWVST